VVFFPLIVILAIFSSKIVLLLTTFMALMDVDVATAFFFFVAFSVNLEIRWI
jgi:hypothetical protein